jgi:hypothetical protein
MLWLYFEVQALEFPDLYSCNNSMKSLSEFDRFPLNAQQFLGPWIAPMFGMNPKMPLKFIANCYGQYELMIWESRDC